MKINKIIFILLLTSAWSMSWAQSKVGIGTTNPTRELEIRGFGVQYLRIQSNATIGNEAGVELIRGNDMGSARDWKIANNALGLRVATSTDNFATSETELIVKDNGYVGLGTLYPATRVHVTGGQSATNSNNGYLMIGQENSSNLVFDNNGMIARDNGSPSPLFIQNNGGNTYLGYSNFASSTFVPGGNVVVGGGLEGALLNIQSDSKFQMRMANGDNNWRIGATNQNWSVGDDQLVFTPTISSGDAPLRLMDVGDNDGVVAPVVIASSLNQTMLLDGNEIDCATGALYINHNSENDTYVNPSGGLVGVGTNNPHGMMHVVTDNFALALQRETTTWKLAPTASGDVIFSNNTNGPVALISYNGGGSWVPLSDSTRKEHVVPVENAMEIIGDLSLHRYNMKSSDPRRGDIGVIAQDLEQVLPEAVFQNEGQYGVTYDQLSALAIKGVQEQQKALEEIQRQVTAIKEQDRR